MSLRVTFAGAGDAFGSGGRLQACVHMRPDGGAPVLLDCGATALVGLKRNSLEPNEVGLVVLSHLHGDHFAGLPYLVLDGQFRHRAAALDVVGPPGTEARLRQAMEVLFPASTRIERAFEVRVHEIEPDAALTVSGVDVRAYPAEHFAGDPALSVRVRLGERTVGYSGDTAWNDALVEVAREADLFICEGYTLGRSAPFHLHLPDLVAHRDRLTCRRLVLVHAGPEVLAARAELGLELADDDLVLDL